MLILEYLINLFEVKLKLVLKTVTEIEQNLNKTLTKRLTRVFV